MAIDISGFTDNMDRYIKKNEDDIAVNVFQESVTSGYCRSVVNAKGEYQMATSQIGSIIQPFQMAWTPKGTPLFKPARIQVRRCKVDIELEPDVIMDEWMGFLADEGLEPKDYPIVKYIMDTLIIPQIQEDRELNMIYTGVYDEPTSGTAGNAADSYDGFEAIMDQYDTAGTIAPIALGTITTANAFDKVEEFHDALPFKQQQRSLNVFMSDTIRKWHARDRRATYGSNMNYDPTTQNAKIDFTPHSLVGLPSMAGKQRIWTTPPRNMVRLFDKADPAQRLSWTIEKSKRKVFVFTQWHEAVGFAFPELVFMSDGDIA